MLPFSTTSAATAHGLHLKLKLLINVYFCPPKRRRYDIMAKGLLVKKLCVTFAYTIEPLNNGHIATSHFVHYGKVVLSSEVKNFIIGTSKTFIWRLLTLFPLFEVSVIRGYTIYMYVCIIYLLSRIPAVGSTMWM